MLTGLAEPVQTNAPSPDPVAPVYPLQTKHPVEQANEGGEPAGPHPAQPIVPDALLREKYRLLASQHLKRLPLLFKKFTGVSSHLVWAPAWPQAWSAHALPTHSQLCRQVGSTADGNLAACRRCAERHLALALEAGHHGHCFTCFLAVHNYWLPIIVRGCLVGLAFVQAPAAQRSGTPSPGTEGRRGGIGGGRTRGMREQPMSRKEFRDAAKLLQLVFRHVETAAVADLRQTDLKRAQQALVELQTVASRLRTELNGLVPALGKSAPLLEAETRTNRLVQAAVEYIHRNYTQPLTLEEYASRVHLNASYLSAEFSRTVGLPFKTYLTELRVEKARELLSDPTRNVAEVAYSVGYSSENRFRAAFKRATGLSPRRWRETFRMPSAGSPN